MAQEGSLVLRAGSTVAFDYSINIKNSFEYISNVEPLSFTSTHFNPFRNVHLADNLCPKTLSMVYI